MLARCAAPRARHRQPPPSAQIGAIALFGLLAYDVFWVFLSPLLFAKNVMVEVAQQQAANPARDIVQALPIPQGALPPLHLDLPNKLVLPVCFWAPAGARAAADAQPLLQPGLLCPGFTMLGLGDIALPGLLLALA